MHNIYDGNSFANRVTFNRNAWEICIKLELCKSYDSVVITLTKMVIHSTQFQSLRVVLSGYNQWRCHLKENRQIDVRTKRLKLFQWHGLNMFHMLSSLALIKNNWNAIWVWFFFMNFFHPEEANEIENTGKAANSIKLSGSNANRLWTD